MRARHLMPLVLCFALGLPASSVQAQAPELPPGTLVVLLSGAPGTPMAEEIVGASSHGEALPGAFATGSPIGARTLISTALRGASASGWTRTPITHAASSNGS